MPDDVSVSVLAARSLLLRDLAAYSLDTGPTVSVLDEVLSARQWWVQEWPAGAAFLPCLAAQDLQEALAERVGDWPLCRIDHALANDDDGADAHETTQPHALRVSPDLGEDPHWVCEESGVVVAAVGRLGPCA